MINLNPAETFPIIRIIGNHLETDTLYVRAVIKDAVNDKVLATVDLADKGSYYYRTNWKVVWDNTMARGRFLTITTSVYSDSGYTTKSENYGDEVETYLVQERFDSSRAYGSSEGGGAIDYRELRKVFGEEIGKVKKPKAIDIAELAKEVAKVVVINLPEEKEVEVIDLTPLENSINKLSQELSIRPKFEKTNLSELSTSINELLSKLDTAFKTSIKSSTSKFEENSISSINKAIKLLGKVTTEQIKKAMEEKTVTLNIEANGKVNINSSQEKKDKESNINRLKSKFGIK